jgi:tetratricopeptide (TPR) repeat protein
MDALKKAEQAKQGRLGRADETAPSGSADMELEPLQPPGDQPAPTALPELPAQMEALDAEFLAQANADRAKTEAARKAASPRPAIPRPPPVIRAEPATGVHQAQAHNLFASKQPPAGNKPFAIVVGAGTVLAVVVIGIYFWLQLQPAPGLKAAGPLAAGPGPAPLFPVAPTAAPLGPPPAASPAASLAMQPPERKGRVTRAAAEATRSPARARLAGEPESPIRLTRTTTVKLDPALTRGFDAFNSGNLAAAAASYEQVLKADGRNADALHGLAAIALRQGRANDADELYLRALEADPKDAVAQAALSGLRGKADPVATESRLQSMIASQPDQPFLQFALGNVYAGQSRWPEAQRAYFKAYSGDPENPDYLFNLAVSLDQLHQGKLAMQYYNQALAAASQRPAGFDKAQAANRLRELQP